MHREQTHHFLLGGNVAAWWLPLMLLALAVAFQTSAGSLAAPAEVEIAEQQGDIEEEAEHQPAQEPTQEPTQESAETTDKADSENESEDKGQADTENKDDSEKDLKQDSEKSDEKTEPEEAEPKEDESKGGDQPSTEEGKTEDSKEDTTEDNAEAQKAKSPADSPENENEKTHDKQPGKAEAQPEGDGQANVETERALEVDAPQSDAEKDAEKADRPKPKPEKKKCVIGATATLLEKQSELKFRARVDSGAKSCSLHFEKLKIEDESKKEDVTERMRENIGKVIHFEVKNGDDKTHILTSKIADYVIIKTSDKATGKRRYKVPLTFRWKSTEKEVLVTLNKRSHMEYPLLLGRNFLRGDFLVDVELDSDD